MEIQSFFIILNDLRANLSENEKHYFDENFYSMSLEEISKILSSDNNDDLKKFTAVHMLERLSDSEEINLNNIDYLILLHKVILASEDLRAKCYYHLDPTLRKYVNEATSLTMLYKLAQIAVDLYNFNNEFKEAFICVETQALILYYNYLEILYESDDEETALEGAKYLKKLKKLGYNISSVANLLNSGIIKLFETKIESHNRIIEKKSIQKYLKIINYMLSTEMDEGEIMKLDELESILRSYNVKKSKKYEKIREFEEILNYKDDNLDVLGLIREVKNYFIKIEYFSLTIFQGKYGMIPVIIKDYELSSDLTIYIKSKIRNQIYIEATCLKFISEKKLKSSSIALKYYGLDDKNPNKITLVHENYKENLKSYKMIEKKDYLSSLAENTIEDIVSQLLSIFNELENFSIYHQNISLSSIILDETTPGIIDFFYTTFKNEEFKLNTNIDSSRQDYYWPEMVKKSKNEPGKEDVFALGIVILMITIPNFTVVERTQKFLNDSIEEVPFFKIRALLYKMLSLDCSKRQKFKNLEISGREFETNSAFTSLYPSHD